MVVNKPRNVNDEDLVDGMTDVELPLSQPTSMSYFLQRIRLAELWRELIDRVPLSNSGPETMAHSQVMEVDAKIDKFVEEIPAFFCLDGGSLEEIAETDARRAPGIIIQRYILNSLTPPTLAHEISVSMPREPSSGLSDSWKWEDIPFVLTRLKVSGVLYCVFMAVIVLLLDVCLNKNAAHEESRKAEMVDAYGILEEARGQSTMVAKLLDSLMTVLRKHQVSLPGLDSSLRIDRQPSATTEDTSSSTTPPFGELNIDDRVNDLDGQNLAANPGLSSFDDIWQSFDADMDIDTPFSELNAQFI